MVERLVIARIGNRGDGVADAPGGPLYVPFALPGETVEVEPIAGHLIAGICCRSRGSAERIASICQHFGTCGGCAVRHWSLAPIAAGSAIVIEALSARLDAPVDELVDAHGDGRRRATFHVTGVPITTCSKSALVPARASCDWDRRLPYSCACAQWRDRGGLGNRRRTENRAQAARHRDYSDGRRARHRCAGLGRA
jgi:hypothetical protein